MRYLPLVSLLVIITMFFAAGCNFGHNEEEKGRENSITETYHYKNGTIMIKDNTSYRDYGKTPESFDTIIETENVEVGPDELRFGQE